MSLERRTADWIASRIGPASLDPKERAMRLFEEAAELAQAEGIGIEHARKQLEHVYRRAPGEPAQEAGGVAICLLGWCWSRGRRFVQIAEAELDRIYAKPLSQIRGSLARKADDDLVTYNEPRDISG